MKLAMTLAVLCAAALSLGQTKATDSTVTTPMTVRPSIVGSGFASVQPIKFYGWNITYTAAYPASADVADATVKAICSQIAVPGLTPMIRLHHVDKLAKVSGWGPIKWILDSAKKYGAVVILTLSSEDTGPFGDINYYKAQVIAGTGSDGTLARQDVVSRLSALFKAVGDHPALLAVEPLNEETVGDLTVFQAYQTWAKGAIKAAGFSCYPIFANSGISGAQAAILPGMPLVSLHGYGDDAREPDPLQKGYDTDWATQPWQWNDSFTIGTNLPRCYLEVGSLYPNPLRLKNEIGLACQAKATGASALCWFLWASNADMTASGPFLDRYCTKEPLRAVAEHLGQFIYADPSAIQMNTVGTECTYVTDQVQFRTKGDLWGENLLTCIVSADGQPIATSSHLFLTGGGTAFPTGQVTTPLQADGKYFSITGGALPWITAGGGPVKFANVGKSLKAFYFDPITRKQTGPALIQQVTPGNWVVWTAGGLEVEVIAS